jgi:predicted nucleic acid-binding protein
VIIFDSSFLVILLHPNPPPAMDRENKAVEQFRERVSYLATRMDHANEVIGVPAPAMAEVLVNAGAARAKYVSILSDTWKFQIIPFDSRAAIEAAELIEKIKPNRQPRATFAKVKFDIQIVAIAKAEDATVIYSDDRDIENYAKRVNLKVIRICDLPLPPPPEPKPFQEKLLPVGAQGMLPLKPRSQEPKESKIDEFEPRNQEPEKQQTDLNASTTETGGSSPARGEHTSPTTRARSEAEK